jgi:hypothetical protein
MKYNPDGHDVHMMAKKLLVAPPAPLHPYRGRCFAVWQQGWRGTERADRRRVLHAWRQVMLENKWDRESAEIQKKFTGAPSGGGGGAGGKRLAEEPLDDNAPLSFDEKRDLCASMNKLPGKQVGVASGAPHCARCAVARCAVVPLPRGAAGGQETDAEGAREQLARAVALIHEMVPKVVMQNGDDPDGLPSLPLPRPASKPRVRHSERMRRVQRSR